MILHSIHVPVSARQFVAPLARRLCRSGMPTVIAVGTRLGQERHLAAMMRDPLVLIESDLSRSLPIMARRLWAWYRLVRRMRPRVVHAHQMRAAMIPLFAAWIAGVPVRIYHNHGLPYLGHSGPMRWGLRLLERINLMWSTDVWFVSRSNCQEAHRDGLLCGRRFSVIGAGSAVGIDLQAWSEAHIGSASRTAKRAALGLAPSTFTVLFVGRPTRRKGFEDLLSAWIDGGFAERGGRLLCAGFSHTEVPAHLQPLPAGVQPCGMIEDMRPWYAACDVVCLPSWHEGFPYALLECAAAGRPSVGTDIPGIRCAIRHDHTGLLVPVRNATAVTAALRRLEGEREVCELLGAGGRRMVERWFDQETVLNQQEKWYRSRIHPIASSAGID